MLIDPRLISPEKLPKLYIIIWHEKDLVCTNITSVLARDSIYAIARYMSSPVRPSVRLSIRPSHGWISQRRLKLGSRNLHHRVAPWL